MLAPSVSICPWDCSEGSLWGKPPGALLPVGPRGFGAVRLVDRLSQMAFTHGSNSPMAYHIF